MIATIDWVAVGLACLLLLVVLGLASLIVRRHLIARGEPLAMVAVERGEGWKLRMTRFSTDSVQGFSVIGVGLRPRFVWRRGDLDLGAPSVLARNKPIAITDPVQVECTVGDETFLIAIAPGDYTALRSWSESAPPGLNANVA
ncbi:hypothetical protein GCM10011492_01500 [Flexivirga endophytica]|uniref:DUF2550 family protein n=1 Tax=Flexivirga endophytica TaxID=1849103 RepID=A0A916WM93_9MICO|nr:DUF2550 family protein [Flexivirga endophytica]GGB15506.1 hypothetical protein GCM10011492_01500 [Flexivirga endophytica]GHB40062.1 hypothetical protein GCM10008112_06120 [Flexivirga endophytica]